MAITQAMCTSFKKECLEAVHNLSASGGDTFKVALYSSAATLGAATTAYTSSGEVTGTGYVAGGVNLTNLGTSSGGVVGFADFADPTFPSVTITTRGALIYNSSKANRAVGVLDFGEDKVVSAGNFVINLPTPDAANAIVRFQ
jgi:hypothetical protein